MTNEDIKLKIEADKRRQSLEGTPYSKDFRNSMSDIRDISYTTGFSQLYDKTWDGDYEMKYKNYLGLENNEDRLARQQSAWEQVGNGLSKNLMKTGLYALDGINTFTYGLYSAIKDGEIKSLWNNDVSNYLDDQAKRLDRNFANYYTNEEKSKGFLGRLWENPANFLANDVAGGLAFVGGAVLPELALGVLTGGASIAPSLAKFGAKVGLKKAFGMADNIAEGVAREGIEAGVTRTASEIASQEARSGLRGLVRGSNVGNTAGQVLNTARFVGQSTFFEAGMEARHNFKSSVEDYMTKYQEREGKLPSQDELTEFIRDAGKSADYVFAANVGLLSITNAAMFGKVFKLPSMNVETKIGKLFGIDVTKLPTGKLAIKEATKAQKVLGKTYFLTKKPFSEGIVEEGMQGVFGHTMGNYLDSKYDPTQPDMTLMQSFGEALEEQYTTKEGWFEIGIGALIGSIGGNVSGDFGIEGVGKKGYKGAVKSLEGKVNTYNTEVSNILHGKTADSFKGLIRANSVLNYQANREAGIDSTPAFHDTLVNFNYIKANEALKGYTDTVLDFETAVDGMQLTEEQMKSFGFKDMAQVEEYKTALKENFKKDYDTYNEVEAVVNNLQVPDFKEGDLAEFKDAVTFSLMAGKKAGTEAEKIANNLSQIIGTDGIYDALKFSQEMDEKFDNNIQTLKEKQSRLEELKNEIIDVGQRLQESKDNEVLYKENSKKHLILAQEIKKLTDETIQLESVLESDFKAAQDNITFSPKQLATTSIRDIIQKLDSLQEYTDSLRKMGRTKEAENIETLLEQFKLYSSAEINSVNTIRRMASTNFYSTSEGKGLLSKIKGKDYSMSDQARKDIKDGEAIVRSILVKNGFEATDVDKTIEDLLKNNTKLSEREKFKMESMLRATLAYKRIQEVVKEASEEQARTEQEAVKKEDFSQEGDTIFMSKKLEGNDLTNPETINELIKDITSQIDAIVNEPTAESLREIKAKEKQIEQLRQQIIDLQNQPVKEQEISQTTSINKNEIEAKKAEIIQTNEPNIQTIGNVTFGTANKQGQTDNNEDAVYVDKKNGIFILADGMGGEGMITLSPAQASKEVVSRLLEKQEKTLTDLIYEEYLKNPNISSDDVVKFLISKGFQKPNSIFITPMLNAFKTKADLSSKKGFRSGATALKAVKTGNNTYAIEKVGDTVFFVVDKNGKVIQQHGLSDVATTQGYMFSVKDGKPFSSTPKTDNFTITLNEGETLVLATDFIETDKAIQDFINSDFGKKLDFAKFQKENKSDDSTFITIKYDAELTTLEVTTEDDNLTILESLQRDLEFELNSEFGSPEMAEKIKEQIDSLTEQEIDEVINEIEQEDEGNQTVSEIEAKKAKIEKLKKDKQDELTTLNVGDSYDVISSTGSYDGTWKIVEITDKFYRMTNEAGGKLNMLKARVEENLKRPDTVTETKYRKSNREEINAKYDAELKALENNAPTNETEQSVPTDIEAKKAEIKEDKFDREFSQAIDKLNNFFTNTLGLSIKFDGSGRRKLDNGKEVVTYEISIYQNGKVIGNTGFKVVDGKIEISLTEINEELQGKGITSVLYQDINSALQQLGYGVLYSDTTFLEDSRKQETFLILDGKELSLDETSEFLLSLEDPLEDLEKLKEEGRVQEIKKTKPGEKLWQSLERKRLAEKLENGQYRFINAKYDAELKALEEQLKTQKNDTTRKNGTDIGGETITNTDGTNREDVQQETVETPQSTDTTSDIENQIQEITQSIQRLENEIDDLRMPFKFMESEGYIRYNELLKKKIANAELSEQEQTEMDNLKSSINQWITITGVRVQGIELSDLIRQMQALEETRPEEEPETEEVNDIDFDEDVRLSESAVQNNYDIGLAYNAVVLRRVKGGVVVSNISPKAFEEETGVNMEEAEVSETGGIVVNATMADNINKQGKVVLVNPAFDENTSMYPTVLKVAKHPITGEEDFVPLSSDFDFEVDENGKPLLDENGDPVLYEEGTISPETIYESEEGEKVLIKIDPNHPYNVKLLNKLRTAMGVTKPLTEAERKAEVDKIVQAKSLKSKRIQDTQVEVSKLQEKERLTISEKSKLGQLTKRLSDEIQKLRDTAEDEVDNRKEKAPKKPSQELVEEIIRDLRLMVVTLEGASNLAVLKKIRMSEGYEGTNTHFEALRIKLLSDPQKLLDLVEANNTETYDEGITITKIFMGNPNYNYARNEEGRLVRVNKPIVKEDLSKIADIGYVENGELKLRGGTRKGVNQDFINSAKKKNSKSRIPVIVIKRGKQLIAYPVKVGRNESPIDLDTFKSIFESDSITAVDKAIRLNTMLAQAGIDIKQKGNAFVVIGDNELNKEFFDNIFAQLEQKEYIRSVESWTDPKQSISDALLENATINIKLSNPFISPKIKFDFSSVEVEQLPETKKKSTKKAVVTHKESELKNFRCKK